MRVYLVGSHSVGKTTLCRYISETYKLPMICEVARAVLAELEAPLESLRTDLDLVNRYQELVFDRQLDAESAHPEGFVSDRAFDNMAYAAEHSTTSSKLFSSAGFQEYMKWVKKGTVFFLRPNLRLLKEDGVRETPTWESVLRIDGMLKLLLEIYGVSYLPIESASMQERARIVQFVLGRETNGA